MFLFDKKFKIDLYSKAATSPRRRDHFNIHNDYQDPVQRIAIALLHGTYIPPHKHTQSHQWEFFHVVEGEVKLILFSEQGTVTEIYLLGDKHKVFAVQLPPNIFHTLVCISSKAFIFEWKQGPFVLDTAKEMPHWSMPENDINISSKVQHLEKVIIGDNFTDNI